jgi:methoxymalonate biosynthesis acyl carrier protein
MSQPTHIQVQLLEFLRREVFSPQTAVTEDTDLIASGFDSLSLMRLLLFIEKTYGLWIPEGEITETTLKTTRSLATVVVRLIDERHTPS